MSIRPGSQLRTVHPDSGRNAVHVGCHEMCLLTSTADRPEQQRRYECKWCTLYRVAGFSDELGEKDVQH